MKVIPFEKVLSSFVRPLKALNLIEVNREAILHNFDTFKDYQPQSHIFPVVKSNAYGHGLAQVVQILRQRQFDYYIADSYLEALKIWQIDNRPVLLIGPNHPDNYSLMNLDCLALTIYDLASLEALGKTQKPVRIHLKINTGMNRQGIGLSQIPQFLSALKRYPRIQLEGLISHLADADGDTQTFTQSQLKLFQQSLSLITTTGHQPKYVHLSATYGANRFLDPAINTLRLGLGLYGYGPLPQLSPSLRLTSSLTRIATIKKGEKVGYNCTYSAPKTIQIGLLPLGYYEGLDRRLGNLGVVKYQNQYCPIIGRISMNLAVVDLKDTSPKLYDQVEIFSPNPADLNSIPQTASLCQTIPYDILVHLNESIRRQIV
jgi:alanine racemase